MFVRIIYEKGQNKSETEVTYECKRVSYTPKIITEDPKVTEGLLVINDAHYEKTITINGKENMQIILMNNEGKTIDRKMYQIGC